MEVIRAVRDLGQPEMRRKFEDALECIARILNLYGSSRVAFSFNGGKDSTVLLHLIRATIAAENLNMKEGSCCSNEMGDVCSFIFNKETDFIEVQEFIGDMNEKFSLNLCYLTGKFETGLEELIQTRNIKAIILGTRRNDPNALGQDICCLSSKPYPVFMRINPILNWTYSEVWNFLQSSSVPYCSLYDKGYTSLGSVEGTLQNSALLKENGSYAPAFALVDERLERLGRKNASVTKGETKMPLQRGVCILDVFKDISSNFSNVSSKLFEPFVGEMCKIGLSLSKMVKQTIHTLAYINCPYHDKITKLVTLEIDCDALEDEIKFASDHYDTVFIVGDMGPEDFKTIINALAVSFGIEISRNLVTEWLIHQYFNDNLNSDYTHFANVPSSLSSTLYYKNFGVKAFPYPLISLKNIYLLPKNPDLLSKSWESSCIGNNLTLDLISESICELNENLNLLLSQEFLDLELKEDLIVQHNVTK